MVILLRYWNDLTVLVKAAAGKAIPSDPLGRDIGGAILRRKRAGQNI